MANKKIDITTQSVDETQKLGQKIGTLLKYPLIIALIGDLGSGKTAFVQGLAGGLDVSADYYITSPTFTLINEYPGRLPLFHVDLYRLETLNDLDAIGLDELLCDRAVIAIEWADKLSVDLSNEYLAVRFQIIDENCRKVKMIGYGQNGINLIRALEEG
ncbi:MAG: tRNA (adenosine(37)-N6)-threonylcarbamoyltransferase complex ATPase subunit type 1 TsaE [Deltaproteobacteria bacterium]|jgi:tRNA threonylcarbamoyladenosine biosynthesis protein TsaE|nr:tRNA (adenosine(37)-N6)-threonylcarbamoyltransferase complex ATPase subunit type 1 TsaE [Deltaproteobacteria bacterium]